MTKMFGFAAMAVLSQYASAQSEVATLKMPVVGTNEQDPGGGEGSGKYEYETHGGKPVVVSAEVKFTKADLNHGSEPTAPVEHYARSLGNSDDDAGHIYANQLGGLAEPINIFPQSPKVNRGAYRMFETQIYNCMKTGGASKATLNWKFTYSGTSSTRPTGVTYSAKFGSDSDTIVDAGCTKLSKKFGNGDSEDTVLEIDNNSTVLV